MTIRSGVLSKMIGCAWAPLTVVPAGDGGASAPSFGDNDLNSFAVAAVRVHRINNAFSHKIEEAQTEPEKLQIERQATSEMVKAVNDEGLTVDTYQAIAISLETDADLAARVKQRIKKVA